MKGARTRTRAPFLAPVRAASRPGVAGGRVPSAVYAWAFDTGGSGTDERRASWIRFVEGSLAFQQAAFELKPLRYKVWQDSAE
jgi:hypothetical protein